MLGCCPRLGPRFINRVPVELVVPRDENHGHVIPADVPVQPSHGSGQPFAHVAGHHAHIGIRHKERRPFCEVTVNVRENPELHVSSPSRCSGQRTTIPVTSEYPSRPSGVPQTSQVVRATSSARSGFMQTPHDILGKARPADLGVDFHQPVP